jgi:DNA invertase Pin-like site-specific DNA recombinase
MNDEFIDVDKADINYERNQTIISLIDKGFSYAEIGRQIGLTRARVSQIALEYGYVVRPSLVNLDKYKSKGNG